MWDGPTNCAVADFQFAKARNTGKDDLEVIVVLNNGTYQSVSITAWMAGTPDLLFATNFGVKESIFEKMPGDAVIMPD